MAVSLALPGLGTAQSQFFLGYIWINQLWPLIQELLFIMPCNFAHFDQIEYIV
jgi:hypothetical protein